MKITNQGSKLTCTVDNHGYYLSRSLSPKVYEDVHASVSIPHPMSCVISRIWHGLFLVDRFRSDFSSSEVSVSAAHGEHLFEIELEKNEILSFQIKFLVGFTYHTYLHTCISFSLSSILANKIFVQVARGPCKLLFCCSGVHEIALSETAKFAFSPERMVAWHPKTNFSFSGIKKAIDIYFNPVRLRIANAKSQTYVILDSDDHKESRSTVLSRIKEVLIP